MNVQPVILAGGSGTRLWPLSRGLYPKQFMDLGAGSCMFEAAVMRACALKNSLPPLIVAHHDHRFMVAELLQKHGLLERGAQIIIEPESKNTAPAVAAAALAAMAGGADPLLLVKPADHIIGSQQGFSNSVNLAAEAAGQGRAVVFGVAPDSPATGYGYIRPGEELEPSGVHAVGAFVEKPAAERAAEFLSQGSYLWNSGMLMCKASVLVAELERHAPEVLDAAGKAWERRLKDLDFIRLDAESYKAGPSISLDYAILEKTSNAAVVRLQSSWCDLGSWDAFYESSPYDAEGNSVTGDVLLRDSKGSYVHASSRLVAGIGLEDMLVVETPDAVLVARKGRSQEVREVVELLQQNGRAEASTHLKVYRPWGSYEILALAPRFQVKRIIIKPGRAISLQRHRHRAEHWVVVSGTARVLLEDANSRLEEHLMPEDTSIYVPLGARHMLVNPGQTDLEIIEVQSGGYLGEDDIERFADMYGRADAERP